MLFRIVAGNVVRYCRAASRMQAREIIAGSFPRLFERALIQPIDSVQSVGQRGYDRACNSAESMRQIIGRSSGKVEKINSFYMPERAKQQEANNFISQFV